jgi:hypothetical protein
MPGISIVNGPNLDEKSKECLNYEEKIQVNSVIESSTFNVLLSGFEGYPWIQIQNNQYSIVLEGRIYNFKQSNVEQKLEELAIAFIRNDSFRPLLTQFIHDYHGEFLVLIRCNSTERILFFCDRWGRLPCYYLHRIDGSIISRELKFLLYYLPEIKYSTTAIVEYLSLRYCLGNKTIIRDIVRLLPGEIILGDKQETKIETLIPLNVRYSGLSNLKMEDYVTNAKEILLRNTDNMLKQTRDFETLVVDISGGYDTRAVFGAVCQFTRDIVPITIDLVTGDESSVARIVANQYNKELEFISPERKFGFASIQDVLYKTDGFVNAWASLSSYEERELLRDRHAQPIAEFQGFGGEFLRHPLSKKRYHKSMLDVIISDPISTTLIESSCKCLGVDVENVLNEWIKYFDDNYHEDTMEDRIAHYYFEYYNALVGKGEDRSRIHVWTLNPMMSSELLDFAMTQIPRDFISFTFFENLLKEIDAKIDVSLIPIWGHRFWRSRVFKFIDSSRFLRDLGKRFYMRKWRKAARTDKRREILISKTFELFDTTNTIQRYFKRDAVERFLENECGPNARFLWQLLSLFFFMNTNEMNHTKQVSI